MLIYSITPKSCFYHLKEARSTEQLLEQGVDPFRAAQLHFLLMAIKMLRGKRRELNVAFLELNLIRICGCDGQ